MAGIRLTPDMLAAEEAVTEQYNDLIPPFTREGISLFERHDRKYMLTSGMTGYIPNQSGSASSDHWNTSFTYNGNPYVDDITLSSFSSQFTQVLHIPGTDRYIALSDRWVPGYPVDAARADLIRRCIAMRYNPEHYQATPEERAEMARSPMLETANTSLAEYVWLPLQFTDDGKVRIQWLDEWTL